VVAGGSGQRFGAPKQFLELGGRPIIAWSVAAARSVADGVVVVVPGTEGDGGPHAEVDADVVVAGGSTRAVSVRAGLKAVPDDADVVVVHDAARPLASPALFEAVVTAVRGGAEGAVPVIPVGDTLKRAADGTITATVDRADLVAVQTPQAFAAATLRRAHAGAPQATDDAGLVERIGATVRTVDGDPRNLKLTQPGDFPLLEAVVGAMSRPPGG
jgi:2-C-methyl-D-erythritol 4-phosphate cytidylyltransferase